jgi:hypothetical protein
LEAKHIIEEAMTAALLRKCNACNKPFLKEDGCNKMICPCGNMQCYICSETISGYEHFNRRQLGTEEVLCPMYDDTEQRLEREVAVAQQEALIEVIGRRGSTLREEEVVVDGELVTKLGRLRVDKGDMPEIIEAEDEDKVDEEGILYQATEVRRNPDLRHNNPRHQREGCIIS